MLIKRCQYPENFESHCLRTFENLHLKHKKARKEATRKAKTLMVTDQRGQEGNYG